MNRIPSVCACVMLAVLIISCSMPGSGSGPTPSAAAGNSAPAPSGAAPAKQPAPTTPTRIVAVRGDLHMHTTCEGGSNSYEEMVQKALSLRYDFIAVTNYYFPGGTACTAQNGCNEAVCQDDITKCLNEGRLLCIPGMEIAGRLHLLALGINKGIDAHLPLKSQVDEIHRQGGLAVAAHPLTPAPAVYTEEELGNSGLDGLECGFGANIDRTLDAISQKYGLPCVYNSNAHDVSKLGTHALGCEVPVKTVADFKQALSRRECFELQ